MNMIKHSMKSKNIDEYGAIREIVFIDNHFILLADYYNSKTYCEIIKTNFLDYRNTYNLLEKSKIFPLNFLQKINNSTLFINSFFDFTKEYFHMKGLTVIFPIEIFKNRSYNNEDFNIEYYWFYDQKYIALQRKNVFKKVNSKWLNKDYTFKITIFNNENNVLEDIPLLYREKQNLFNSLFNKNENLISYIYQYKFCEEYFAFICLDNLFVVNIKTTKNCRYKLDSKFYVIQEINDKKEIILIFHKNIIVLKLEHDELYKILDQNLKNTIKAAKLVDNKLIVVFSKSVKIYNKFDFALIKQYGFTKLHLPKIIHTVGNKFVIIYRVYNYNKASIKWEQKISFLET